MILIPLNSDKKEISNRFRKSEYFAIIGKDGTEIFKNSHKSSKSAQFFEYFKTLNIDNIYLKALGYKTFLKLNELGIDVYFTDATTIDDINSSNLTKIDLSNAKELCKLGH